MTQRLRPLFFGSLQRQLTLGSTLFFALSLLFLVGNLLHRQEERAVLEQRQQVLALAQSLAASTALWVAAHDFAGMQKSIDSLASYPGLQHAILLDTRGKILAHNERKRRGLYLELPTETQAKAGASVLYSQHLALEVIAPVRLQGAIIGWLRIGVVNQALAEELQQLSRKAYLFASLAIALAAFFAHLAVSYLTRRLALIKRVTDAVERGEHLERVLLDGDDEAARLGHAINTMLDALARSEARLTEQQATLEKEVALRTSDLVQARDAAETASRAKSTFLANMSHELRTPMNAIMGLTAILRRRTEDASAAEQLGKIDHASRHLLHIINDILDLSKIEAERINLEKRDFLLSSVLENTLSLLSHRAASKGLHLHSVVAPELARRQVLGDPARIGQVLLNLASNAVKFTHTGSIELRLTGMQTQNSQLDLHFSVRDSGIGIAPEVLARLFRPFEQADNSTTREHGGTGLGLAISKRLVELMGGKIGVDSRPGEGSTFWFTLTLPVLDDTAAPASEARADAPQCTAELALRSQSPGTRVLLVEDEPINREVSLALLEDVGFDVDLAEDGVIALALAKENDYALILMDIQMPRMNGLDASRAIRLLPRHAATPILAMTANAFAEDRLACLEAGMNEHISKPIDPERLYSTLLHWLAQPAAHA
ncbi:ATP-binding protein [Azonexus sp.]|uniref:ATP-binding protein n=1 Tax=Azonexus sp. TaxID=1872668 RepID=UPI0039E59FDA